MSFVPSNLMEEIRANTEALSTNTYGLSSAIVQQPRKNKPINYSNNTNADKTYMSLFGSMRFQAF